MRIMSSVAHKIKEVLKIAFTTTNASDIGIMYITLGIISLIIGSVEATIMRTQLTFNNIGPTTYYDALTLHGIFMIFFVVMPLSAGLANYLVPRMIGAHDLYWPKINALSFWILVPAVTLTAISPLVGVVNAGWYMYAPLSVDLQVNSGIGMDVIEIALIIAGISSTLTGINFILTITRLKKIPYFKMPLFVWAFFSTAILLMIALPPLTAGLAMAFLERNWGFQFFNANAGGNPLLWQNVFWFFGHPEVYILILPAMGIIGEVLPRSVGRQIYGYKALALSSFAIAFLSAMGVWMHHMFTSIFNFWADAVSSAITMAIAIPSGVKVVNWTATFYQGKLRVTGYSLLTIGFIALFLVGGITGVLFPLIPLDYDLNGTYAVVGHFHYMVFAIVVAFLAALLYYFPYFTGKMYDMELSKSGAIMTVAGAFVIATGMFVEGVLGMPRRYAWVPSMIYYPFQILIDVGGVIMGLGLVLIFGNLLYSWVKGKRVESLDPWGVEAIGLPDFYIKPVALPLTFGRAMDGSIPEHRHGTFLPSLMGILMFLPGLGFLFILRFGLLDVGLPMILAFLAVGGYWAYHDYFKGLYPSVPSIRPPGGFEMTKMAGSPFSGSSNTLSVTPEGIQKAMQTRTIVLYLIIAEIFLFGGFIGGYLYTINWTPAAQPYLASFHVDWYGLPLAMTIILLSSSIPSHFAYDSLLKGKLKRFKYLGLATFLMGLTFLSGQMYEFTHIIHFTPQENIITSFFFTIVWLHGFHVIMGLTLWAFTLLRARRIIPYEASTAASYYWHFVDGIWVIVFTMLYLQLPFYHPFTPGQISFFGI
ncbi:cbb3-type cytochrome c oxidase subunit I [Sulfurisphaera tokodaii]|uniref:Quinol oxidase subunit I/III n=2 Tax=Sulfurisphaera tokodaii TaxID=111955 RepID=F9VMK3_SULTO|nr:quinol oxidase subunit I/III [Sulfurisphaera tokodaii str. 7]